MLFINLLEVLLAAKYLNLINPILFGIPLFLLWLKGQIGGGDLKLLTILSLTLTIPQTLILLATIFIVTVITTIFIHITNPKFPRYKTINSKLLTEGDTIYKPILIPPNIKIKPHTPISKYQAKLIQKHKRKVQIPNSLPLAPILTISYLLTPYLPYLIP